MTASPKGTKNARTFPKSDLGNFDVRSTVHSPLPRILFEQVARAVLGSRYELSLVICGDTLARRINNESRHKDYAPNVLSFPLEKNVGEIFLNIRKAEREAKQMHISLRSHLAHLYVHGCLHLAGYDHSETMEKREDNVLTHFDLI